MQRATFGTLIHQLWNVGDKKREVVDHNTNDRSRECTHNRVDPSVTNENSE